MRRRTVVNLVDGRTSLMGARRWSWPWQVRLVDATCTEGHGEPVPVDGTVVVPRRQVLWMQAVR